MSERIKTVKVRTLGELLNAGFLPNGENLTHTKTGATLRMPTLTSYQGRGALVPVNTGNTDWPITIDGHLFPKEAIIPEHAIVKDGGLADAFIVYEDGSIFSRALGRNLEKTAAESLRIALDNLP